MKSVTNLTPNTVQGSVSGGSSSGGSFSSPVFRVGGLDNATTTPTVSATSTCPYFVLNSKKGNKNSEIIKIKKFLNLFMNEKLNVNSNSYDSALFNAVKRFQVKYKAQILTPLKLKSATGFWYASTKSQANVLMGCR
ncbi:hypothetical protein H7X65_01545 [Candidatus Parcubacteria bacterium]|nr:hypothetical protein [Candidatus Parcubacteria bacterium]